MNEKSKQVDKSPATVPQREGEHAQAVTPFMQMLERVANNPEIDADKMQRLLDMQIQVLDREARDEFFDAMNRVQMNLPSVARDARNEQTHSTYATLDSISRQIKPIYTAEGFSTSFRQEPSDIENYIRIAGTLRHRAGHSEDSHVDMPLDKTGIKGSVNKTDVHATGSTFTYGRRYLTCLMFDIATGDDLDGNQPAEGLDEEQAAAIEAMLTELSKEHQVEFWQKARVTEMSELLAHRYQTYFDWLETKRAEA